MAGLANTGAIFNTVVKVLTRIAPASDYSIDTLERLFPLLPWFMAYARTVIVFSDWHSRAFMIGSFIIFFLIIIVILSAQHLLLTAVGHGAKKRVATEFNRLIGGIKHIHLARLFAINALSWLALTILTSAGILFISSNLWLNSGNIFLAHLAALALLLPLAFALNAVAITALIHVVKHEDSLGIALREGLFLLKRHCLTCLEFAFLLFLANFFASLLLLTILLATALLTGLLFEVMLATGSIFLMSFATFIGLVLGISIWVAFAGAITLFNYTGWTLLENMLKRKLHLPALEHILSVLKQK